MFKKLLSLFGAQDKRRSARVPVKALDNVMLFIDGHGYHLKNMSKEGLGIIDEGQATFKIGQKLKGDLEIFMEERCGLELKVVRNSDGIVGLQLTSVHADYGRLVKKITGNMA